MLLDRRWVVALLTAVVAVAATAGCTGSRSAEPALVPVVPGRAASAAPTEQLRVEVLARYPHDTAAFTQGLELAGSDLYEGTGQYGESELRVVDLASGTVRRRVSLPDTAFGEGITVLESRVWQITWREGVAYERDRETLDVLREVTYDGEGWGICHDDAGDRLVMSDGTDRLTFRDPATFEPTGSVTVTRDGTPLRDINELECVDGQVWANVWRTDEIVRIDPTSGQVVAEVDAGDLLTGAEQAGVDVLNGIAAVPGTDDFLITGKYWPALFRVRFVPGS